MVLPDLGLICEIMLMAEGFQSSKLLSRKFVILYKLCEVCVCGRGGDKVLSGFAGQWRDVGGVCDEAIVVYG